MWFSLSAIPAGATINSAYLYLGVRAAQHVADPPGFPYDFTLNCHRVTSTWNEYTTTHASAPSTVFESSVIYPAAGFANKDYCDLTNLVQSWVDGTLPNNGILVEKADLLTDLFTYYASREGTLNNRPTLRVTYDSNNTAPSLVFTEPAASATVDAGTPVTVTWDGSDPEDEALVTVGYDEDAVANNGNEHVLGAGLPEDGTLVWDTGGLLSGEARLFGTITDGKVTRQVYLDLDHHHFPVEHRLPVRPGVEHQWHAEHERARRRAGRLRARSDRAAHRPGAK